MIGHNSQQIVRVAALLIAASLVLNACASGATQAKDLLSQIQARGVLRVSTDPNYAPQSFIDSKGELDGFDIDVAKEIARRLGVKVEFATPAWEIITAGNWGGGWDISVGSMAITAERKKVLYFSPPYYYTPAQFGALKDTGITQIEDFSGRTVCVGASTTYEYYLNGTLTLESGMIAKQVSGVKVTTYPTEQECTQAIQAGRKEFDGVLTAGPTLEENIKIGMPLVKVGDAVFYEALAVAMSRSVPNSESLVAAVSKAIENMHQDGTLATLSTKWYGVDLTKQK